MNLVVREGDMVVVYRIPARPSARSIAHCASHEGYQVKENAPFLELDLPVIGTGLGSDESLEVADGVVGAALHAHCVGRCAPSKCGSSREGSECVPLRPRRSLAITCIHRNHVHKFDVTGQEQVVAERWREITRLVDNTTHLYTKMLTSMRGIVL